MLYKIEMESENQITVIANDTASVNGVICFIKSLVKHPK
jgi:hypothetical protein